MSKAENVVFVALIVVLVVTFSLCLWEIASYEPADPACDCPYCGWTGVESERDVLTDTTVDPVYVPTPDGGGVGIDYDTVTFYLCPTCGAVLEVRT